MPRVTFGQARDREPCAAQDTMSRYGLFGVNGTGGMKPALIAEPWAQQVAVSAYQSQDYGLHAF
jgi:hypothetical protein